LTAVAESVTAGATESELGDSQDLGSRAIAFARSHAVLIVFLVAVATSLSGITNGFAFDDIHVIVRNPRLHSLAAPWGLLVETYWRAEMGSMLYRPLTMVVFAVEWVMGNGSPLPFHIVNVLLYAALSAAVCRFAALLMPWRSALIAGILFAVHPVHVEAVANVVGQTELWVALILVVLVDWYVRLRRAGDLRARDVAIMSAAYLAACGFKEHAIVLPGLLLAAEALLVTDARSVSSRFRALLPLLIAMAIAGGAFVYARYAVLHGVAIDSTAPILKGQSFGPRLFTMLGVVVEWIRLLVWPMSLSADYSYPRIQIHDSFDLVMLPAIAILVAIPLIAWQLRKRFPVVVFGLAWTGLAMLIPSNLVVVTGFVLAERTLMLASVGFVLCAGAVLGQLIEAGNDSDARVSQLTVVTLGIFVVALAVRSATRAPVWRDNDSLFAQTVRDVPSSHRAHWMRAIDLSEKKRIPEALDEMDLAVALGDKKDPLLLANAGDMFAVAGRCPRAVTLYRRALVLAPRNIQLRANTAFCLMNIGKVGEAKAIALAIPDDAGDARLQRMAHTADSLELLRVDVSRR
jgi:hypothetical protein